MSRASLAFSSKICSLDSSRSAGSSVIEALPNEGRKSSVWHMISRSTMTSTGRPEGAVKYICRSPLSELNILSGWHPLFSRYAATSRRPLLAQARSMSCPARSRGGKSGQSTRTPSPPSSRSDSFAAAAPSTSATASGSGSSSGLDMPGHSCNAVV